MAYTIRRSFKNFCLTVYPFRGSSQIPYNSKQGEYLQHVVGRIKLPPVKTLSLGGWETVMIVVPALTKGNQGDKPVIATVVIRFESSFAKHMCQGVDRKGPLIEQNGTNNKSVNQHLETGSAGFREKIK